MDVARAATQPWYGIAAGDYRASYAVCRLSGPVKIAHAYHAKSARWDDAALAYVRGWTRYREATLEGCIDGLLHHAPKIAHSWP